MAKPKAMEPEQAPCPRCKQLGHTYGNCPEFTRVNDRIAELMAAGNLNTPEYSQLNERVGELIPEAEAKDDMNRQFDQEQRALNREKPRERRLNNSVGSRSHHRRHGSLDQQDILPHEGQHDHQHTEPTSTLSATPSSASRSRNPISQLVRHPTQSDPTPPDPLPLPTENLDTTRYMLIRTSTRSHRAAIHSDNQRVCYEPYIPPNATKEMIARICGPESGTTCVFVSYDKPVSSIEE
ncbi:uncharacterized protein BDV17DRAFT_289693 [Aspergillus undulatus]|uniref:uncharacterized protein n=1 Tax=Aspergillus undulatus TaxID=1810928 RepID=UPI003CCD974A